MFQVVSIAGLAAALLASALHLLLFGGRRKAATGGRRLRRYSLWERLVLAAVVVSFLVLAVSGFWPALQGRRLSGWLLMIHMTFGGVFAVALALAALRWADNCRYRPHDWEWLKGRGGYFGSEANLPAGRFDAGQKTFFWIGLVLGLTTLVTIMLGMLDLFGPEGTGVLVEIHRYAALLWLVVAILHVYLTTLAKPGARGALISGKVSAEWARRYHPLWWQSLQGRPGK